MSEIELKPCPFCGGEATPVYCENGNRYTSNILMLSKRGTVKCKKCEVCLPRVYRRVSTAIEAWNRRADAVEVVRCKDCKHLMFSDMYGECGRGYLGIVQPNDFCCHGERKEE